MRILARTRDRLRGAGTALAARIGPYAQRVYDWIILVRQGVVRPMRPDRLLRVLLAWWHWGVTLPFGLAVGAIRHPDRPAVIDERGALSYAEMQLRTTRLARALRSRGVREGARVGVLCRNHHGTVETILACAKIGADVVLLNTGLATAQIASIRADQKLRLLVLDEEFAEQTADDEIVLAWTEGPTRRPTLEHLIATAPNGPALPRRPRHARIIVLTSGTTGTPKGAARPDPPGLRPAATILSRIPLRGGERLLLCAPIFHTWGLGGFQLGIVLGATMVLRRKFEPEPALAAIQRHRCTSMFVAPVMLQRLLSLPESQRRGYDHGALRVIASSGSPLPADLVSQVHRAFGAVLYNVYGSTEVSWVSIATPRDLRQAPGTAGRPPRRTRLRLLDSERRPVATGTVGSVFAGNDMLFDGYTNGSGTETVGGLMATGDLGRLDRAGRLFLVGRADDVIVSGAENVFPQDTEQALLALPEIADAAVIGVPDAEFGQRLAAFVVPHEPVDEQSVRTALRSRLPTFALPREIVFLDELPRNATGKVVADQLRGYLPEDG